jgi:hypothetical protein
MIGAALAFERYRIEMVDSPFTVEEYRITQANLESLFQHFYSLSYEMRRAFHYLLDYSTSNCDKKIFF